MSMKITFNNKTIDINERVFWDLDTSRIDPDKHKTIIIERVLTRGELEEFWIIYKGLSSLVAQHLLFYWGTGIL